jgi:hypothetical protein
MGVIGDRIMDFQYANAGNVFALQLANVGSTVSHLWVLVAEAYREDFYRPEKHYMRGPGPKSRAKQSQARLSLNKRR